MPEQILDQLHSQFPEDIIAIETADTFPGARFNPNICLSLMEYVKNDQGYLMLSDLFGVDYSEYEQEQPDDLEEDISLTFDPLQRFSVVYNLYDIENGDRLILEAMIPEENPIIASVTDLWKAARWYEREVWDMYGIRFENHPELKRILLYEEFDGHPLRKDYAKKKRQPRDMHHEKEGNQS